MSRKNSILFRSCSLFLIVIFGFGFVFAQDKKDDNNSDTTVTTTTVAPKVVIRGIGNGNGSGGGLYREDEDDLKITGATVRGRLIYEDTSRPLRYALITLITENGEMYSKYSTKFVKTDENGEFVIKNVKAGTYLSYVKSEGILNQDSYKFSSPRQPPGEKNENADSQFEKITVSGLGEFQIVVRARRGGAISGRILYADGESAVGVKVEALRKEGDRFSNIPASYNSESSVGKAQTDDRGFYRLAGLPEGQYIVRVIEPVSHNQNSGQYIYNVRDSQGSILKTYYPEGENSKNAKEIEILPGQEQVAIDLTLPERQLFGISGKIVKKQSSEPLTNFTVSFFKMSDRDELVAEIYTSGNSATSNKVGEWSLKSLPKGKYRLTISQGSVYTSEKDADKKPTQYPNMSKDIEITDKNLVDLDFEVPVESSISGTIVVEGDKDVPPATGIFVIDDKTKVMGYSDSFMSYNEENQQKVKERPFRVGKLSEGKYWLFFNNQSFYFKSATLGGRDLSNSPIEIKEGEELKGVQIVLAGDMGTVRGKVAGYDGKEQAVVVMVKTGVSLEQSRFGSFSAQIMPTGKFEVKAAPGEYSIFVITFKNRPKTETEAKEWFQNIVKDAQKVSVKSSEIIDFSLNMPN
ncbi:MAG: carboxypeptidase regulatory-like domain-containing protein [Actinomycetota bacterium]